MTTVNNKGFRFFAIATLMAVGIGTTIATGGGGSGGVSPPPTTVGPTLNITAANGGDVASAVVVAIGSSFDIGDITGGTTAASPGNVQSPAKGAVGLFKSFPPGVQQALENCANGGTVDVTVTQANVNTITVGDRIVVAFADCDDGLGYVISGTVDMTISALQGDILTDVFLLGMDVLMTDIVVTEGTSVMTAEGEFTITLDSLDFPVVRMSLVGDSLLLGSDGQQATLTTFDHALQLDLGVSPEALLATVFGRLQSSTLGGSVDYDTTIAIEALGDDDPHVGEILISGADDSSGRIVIIDSNMIQLEIDENGDGTIDEFVDTNWATLNGRESPPVTDSAITSNNAPILARETYNAVLGFGSLTIAAGTQFFTAATFAQSDAMEFSGNFEALQVNCDLGGTATVSGTREAAETYSPGDNLDASFDACSHGFESLYGSMGFSISGFSETPDGFFTVSGNVVETSLTRVHGGTCFSGTGSFDTNHDHMFTSIGRVYSNSSASGFTVSAGGRSQQLSGASVSADIWFPPAPPVVTRESSGVLTGTDISGIFAYQSIVPDEFLVDEDVATGPHSGVLLVTAADNSSMRMVAVDEFNVRLDLDYNGDSVIDESIPTTWAALGYDDMVCPQN